MARRRVAHRDREMAPCRTRPVSSASSSGAVVGEGGVGIEGGAGVAGTSSATFSGMAAVVSGMSCTKAVVLLGRRARTASGVGLNTPSEPRNRETCKLPYIFESGGLPRLVFRDEWSSRFILRRRLDRGSARCGKGQDTEHCDECWHTPGGRFPARCFLRIARADRRLEFVARSRFICGKIWTERGGAKPRHRYVLYAHALPSSNVGPQ